MRLSIDGRGVHELGERIIALHEHYGITGPIGNPANQMRLILDLAHDHVPGFRFDVKVRSDRNYAKAQKDIIILVELSKAKNAGKSVSNAARSLAKRHPEWNLKRESIRQRYYDMIGPIRGTHPTARGERRLERVKRLLRLLTDE